MDEEEFFTRIEQLVRQAASLEAGEDEELDWETFHEPLLRLFRDRILSRGDQNPDRPGQVRIDMGRPDDYGHLKSNQDAILVIDFDWIDDVEDLRFFTKYNLADELLRYAEVGEQGWDVSRQIDQLERTISRLRSEAAVRGWEIPDPMTIYR